MVLVSPLDFTHFWIAASIVLYGVEVVVGLGLYTPALRRQIRVLDAEGVGSANYAAAARRQTVLGVAVSIPVLVIVFLMVFKPERLF